MYNILGVSVVNMMLAKQLTVLSKSNLPSGIYFYDVIENDKTIQSGKVISS